MIKNIIFDVGNVLVKFRDLEYMKDLGFSEELAKYFQKNVVFHPLWKELDRGIMDVSKVIIEMKKNVPGYEKEADLFFERLDEIVSSLPYVRPWILSLKEQGYKIYILSNYPSDLWTGHEKNGRFSFLDIIDGKIVSGFEKVIKPDREIYELLLERYQLKAEECVFLDDREENIEAARKLGMAGIVFTDYESGKATLDDMLKES